MILYCYNTQGDYTGPVAAPLSPARPFVEGRPNYLRPAAATELVPPPCEPGKAVRFDGQAWVQVDDLRGRTAYDTATRQPRTLDRVGPLPEGCTLLVPPSDCHVWDGQAWKPDQARQLVAMRRERNALLAESDWTQLPDADLTETARQAWRVYRQALRDLPAGWTPETPWPAPPKE